MSEKIIHYSVASEPTLAKLEDAVNVKINLGYQPFQQIFFKPEQSAGVHKLEHDYFFQAMVKYEK